MIAARLIAVLAAVLLAAVAVGNAVVKAFGSIAPNTAAQLWKGHPRTQISLGMTEIADAARQGRRVDTSSFDLIRDAGRKMPLAPEPFLVRGIQLRLQGDDAAAVNAFRAAERRDPRSLPAHYFLTELYLTSGRIESGLTEFASLARIAPQGIGSVVPYVAAVAKDRSNWPYLRSLFARNPQLQDATLVSLSQDPANADAILALATSDQRQPQSRWVNPLLSRLVESGEVRRAEDIWEELTHSKGQGALLRDPAFKKTGWTSPFAWALVQSALGLAEPQPGGRLHILYYGQQDGALARQLLLLTPGSYRFSARLIGGGAHAEALAWTIRCSKPASSISSASLQEASGEGWRFEVPANCPAQWLELTGRSADVPQQSDVTISDLQLKREGSGA